MSVPAGVKDISDGVLEYPGGFALAVAVVGFRGSGEARALGLLSSFKGGRSGGMEPSFGVGDWV